MVQTKNETKVPIKQEVKEDAIMESLTFETKPEDVKEEPAIFKFEKLPA